MLAGLLAAVLCASPARQVALYPMRGPDGREVQAEALSRIVRAALEARGATVVTPPAQEVADCSSAACLAAHAKPGVSPVVPTWTAFEAASVLGVMALDDRTGKTFELALPVQSDVLLPAGAQKLAAELGDHLELPSAGEPRMPVDRDVFGLALKLGSSVASISSDAQNVSSINPSFALEGDYLAAPELWLFVELSLILERDAAGQQVQLIPFLLGAKYVFRHETRLRPFAGLALGLDFLSEDLNHDTSSTSTFAVFGVGGLDWFVLEHFALSAEASANLDGLEASSGAGLLFTVRFNFGARVLF